VRGGDSVVGTAGEDLAKYDLVYLKAGTWWKADRDAVVSMPAVGMCTGSISAGDSNYILLWGLIGNLAWAWVDGPIYASSTPGGLTQTAPTTSGYVQSVGSAHGANYMLLAPMWIRNLELTKIEHVHLSTGLLGKKQVGPPEIVIQDNTKMLAFTLNIDDFFYHWAVPEDFAGGDLTVNFMWTNDGGVDDNGKDVKVQLDYQTYADGESIAGSHANSPKTANDTYTSDGGWEPHQTPGMVIAEADFIDKHAISFKGSFITPDGTELTCEPHLIAVGLSYLAYVNI